MPTPTSRETETLNRPRQAAITARRPGKVVLQVCTEGRRTTVEIDDRRVSIGAHPSNALAIDDAAVSSTHCELELTDGGAMLRDHGSKNGTWVDDVKIGEVWVPLGSSFCVGGSTISLLAIDDVEVTVSTTGRFGALRASGTAMGELFAKLERIVDIPIDVLCVGETGTGKELIAKGIHERSSRREGPFVVVDCTNLNRGIAESTLFGHEKGSFTDASRDRGGLLEQADGGTLFLDEIGELPLELQPKLLRALEERKTRRLGEHEYRSFDARVIAATNKDLRRMVCTGTFRDDLYFRIAQLRLDVPPLRERGRGNVALLANLFLEEVAQERGVPLAFEKTVYTVLDGYHWPGNVRELRNAIRPVAMLAEGEVITVGDLPPLDGPNKEQPAVPRELDGLAETISGMLDMEWAEFRRAVGKLYARNLLTKTGGNQTKAAQLAGVTRNNFRGLLRSDDEA